MKLLQDLDLIHQPIAEEDTASLNSLESLEIPESTHTNTHLKSNNSEPYLTVENCTKSMKHVRSLSDVTDLQTDPLSASKDIRNGDVCKEDTTKVKFEIDDFKKGEFTLSVRFIEAGNYYCSSELIWFLLIFFYVPSLRNHYYIAVTLSSRAILQHILNASLFHISASDESFLNLD